MNRLKQYLKNLLSHDFLLTANTADSLTTIEIVVPVFNGYCALVNCIESLLHHCEKEQAITLLDDASTDQQVHDYLDSLSQYSHIKVVKRSTNLGYLHNINQYLATVNSHVLLLNADTQVTAGWLQEMQLIATDPRVGVVCPLSDNATILTLEEVEYFTSRERNLFTGKWYPIPTAVGFCMLVKQPVLQRFGGFDPYYDPGYGEECDYSMLVRQAGWQIACAPGALVKHQGSQSFQSAANDLQTQHQKLLDLRWPEYTREVAKFTAQNPIHFIQQVLLSQQTDQPRILHVVHGIDNKGGVELFTRQLVSKFDSTHHHTVLIPPRNKKFRDQHPFKPSIKLIEIPVALNQPKTTIFNLPADLKQLALDRYFKHMLLSGGFELVHFHSLVGLGSQVWPLICHQLKVPYFLFIHDHSGLCQIFSLSRTIKQQEIYCGKQQVDANDQQCLQCLTDKTKKSELTIPSFLTARTQIWQNIINHAARIQFASEYLRSKYLQTFEQIKPNSEVFSPCFYDSRSKAVRPLNPDKIKLAFLGQFGNLKGAQLFIDLYHQLNKPNIEWQIIGGIDPKFQSQLNLTNIQTIGRYDTEQLGDLLADIDLVIFASQIPETYAITLTEAWYHGIPVVAPDLGAFSHRVKTGKNGLLYTYNDLASLRATVEQYLNNPAIKNIEFIQDNQFQTTALQNQYTQTIESNKRPQAAMAGTAPLMKPPKNSAYLTMEQWLAAPYTLEASADWKSTTAGTAISVLGVDSPWYQSTCINIAELVTAPQFLGIGEVIDTDAGPDILLVIAAGTQLTENIGNWLSAFGSTTASLGLADFALRNQHGQPYAPQFQERFSRTNFQAGHQAVGCLLIKPAHWQAEALQKTLLQPDAFQVLVNQAKQIDYFPYYSYSMLDQHWVNNWKASLAQNNQPVMQKYRLLILLESQLPQDELTKLQTKLNHQSIIQKGQAELVVYASKQKRSVIESISAGNYTHIMMMNDNIRFRNNDCLQRMMWAMLPTELSATSPQTAIDRNPHFLVAKKFGSAPYFHGIGRIRDISFDAPDTVIEHELLDDDLVLFTRSAWLAVLELLTQDTDHYFALQCSAKLHQHGFKTGVINNRSIYKQGLPYNNQPQGDLLNARNSIIKANLQLPVQPNYSRSLSCHTSCELETKQVAFKTPKHLPRVIAYAQDDWASGFYRIKSPLNALAAGNHISVQFLSISDSKKVPTPFELARTEADVLLVHGFYADRQLAALHQYRKQLHLHIVVSIDDLLTHIPTYNPLSKKVPKDVGTRIKLACSLADSLVVSTRELANHFASWHQHITVIPNRLPKSLWPTITNNSRHPNKLRVGWAGAGQHLADLNWIKRLVEASHEQFDWVFFGDFPDGLDPSMIEFHEPVGFLQYPEKLQQLKLDLAVAPLVNNAFNMAKSHLKLLEYGALGVPVLASDLPPYQNSPADLLANQTKIWHDQLQTYHQDRVLLTTKGQQMRAWVEQHHWLEDHLEDWIKVLQLN